MRETSYYYYYYYEENKPLRAEGKERRMGGGEKYVMRQSKLASEHPMQCFHKLLGVLRGGEYKQEKIKTEKKKYRNRQMKRVTTQDNWDKTVYIKKK